VINHEEFASALGWLEFQTELLLEGGKYRRAAGRVREVYRRSFEVSAGEEFGGGLVHSKFQMEIKQPLDSSPINHRAVQPPAKAVGELIETDPWNVRNRQVALSSEAAVTAEGLLAGRSH